MIGFVWVCSFPSSASLPTCHILYQFSLFMCCMNYPPVPEPAPGTQTHQPLGAVLDGDGWRPLPLQCASNLPLRSCRKPVSKPRVPTARYMKNKINLTPHKRGRVLMGDIQVLAGSNEAVRQSLLLCRFLGFTSVLWVDKMQRTVSKGH